MAVPLVKQREAILMCIYIPEPSTGTYITLNLVLATPTMATPSAGFEDSVSFVWTWDYLRVFKSLAQGKRSREVKKYID